MDNVTASLLEYMLEVSQEAVKELVQIRDSKPTTRLSMSQRT